MNGLGLSMWQSAIRNEWGTFGAGASLNLEFASGNQTLDSRVTFTRASSATRTNSAGVLELVSTDVPRFDYDPVTLQPKGLLIEEQRTNLCLRSAEVDSGLYSTLWQFAFGPTPLAPSGTVTAPDGTISGRTYTVQAGATATTGYQQIAVAANTSYTWSVYVRFGTLPSNDYRIAFRDDTAGVFIAQDVVPTLAPIGGGWSRLTYTLTTPVGCLLLRCYSIRNVTTATGGTISFWGAQLEAGAFATSYIPTTTAAATRAADVAVMTGANFSNWYNQSEGTLFAEFSTAWTGSSSLPPINPGLLAVNDAASGAFNGYGSRLVTNATNSVRWGSRNGATTSEITTAFSGFLQAGVPYSFIGAYATNLLAQSVEGGNVVATTDANYGLMTINRLELGFQRIGGTSTNLNGHIRRIAYWPRRLTNTELQGVTA